MSVLIEASGLRLARGPQRQLALPLCLYSSDLFRHH